MSYFQQLVSGWAVRFSVAHILFYEPLYPVPKNSDLQSKSLVASTLDSLTFLPGIWDRGCPKFQSFQGWILQGLLFAVHSRIEKNNLSVCNSKQKLLRTIFRCKGRYIVLLLLGLITILVCFKTAF